MTNLFTAEDAWNGGFHEVAIELGPRSDSRVLAALNTVWNCKSLDGCYLRFDVEPGEQSRIAPSLETTGPNHCRGVASLPNGRYCACGTCVVRENGGSDWLILYLPVGSLAYAYDIGAYPFSDGTESSREWQEPVNAWLVEIAKSVYTVAQFRLALVGHEVSAMTSVTEVERDGIPDEREIGYIWTVDNDLVWYPPTNY